MLLKKVAVLDKISIGYCENVSSVVALWFVLIG